MKNLVCIFLLLMLVSCGASKTAVVKRNPYKKTVARAEGLKNLSSTFRGSLDARRVELLKDAEKYLGAPYKYGGNTSSGFDCSGYTVKVYQENKQNLPRRSSDQAKYGNQIEVERAEPGDLLFFATSGGTSVTHVGIVHDVGNDGEIKFIHASTSKGVIISSLNETYWNKAFLFARRVL